MKRRKRETEVFSLSFLDCICGFGAVLLLFVLTVGKNRIRSLISKRRLSK